MSPVIASLVSLLVTVSAQDGSADQARVESAESRVPTVVLARRAAIREEVVKGATEEWAGQYHEGDGLGVNTTIDLAPENGVAATWFGCLGLYGANEGRVERVGAQTLRFHFNSPNDGGAFGSFSETVRIVHWGERRYLIPEERLVDFVNAINSGLESGLALNLSVFLRDTRGGAVSGLPDLPEPLRAQIRTHPLILTVSRVEQLPEYEAMGGAVCPFRLTFDAPEGTTLLAGQALSSMAGVSHERAEVIGVSRRRVTAKMIVFDSCSDVTDVPKRGWRFTTGAYVTGDPEATSHESSP